MKSFAGRLKRTLKDKCPYCNHPLQLRVKETMAIAAGTDITVDEEYITCSVCDYESEIREPKKRKQRIDKASIKEESFVKEGSNKNARYKVTGRCSKHTEIKNKRSF
jgi:hypothetical protein